VTNKVAMDRATHGPMPGRRQPWADAGQLAQARFALFAEDLFGWALQPPQRLGAAAISLHSKRIAALSLK
jgi:hypothetical protein